MDKKNRPAAIFLITVFLLFFFFICLNKKVENKIVSTNNTSVSSGIYACNTNSAVQDAHTMDIISEDECFEDISVEDTFSAVEPEIKNPAVIEGRLNSVSKFSWQKR